MTNKYLQEISSIINVPVNELEENINTYYETAQDQYDQELLALYDCYFYDLKHPKKPKKIIRRKYKTDKQAKKARNKQIEEYHKKNMTCLAVRFNNETDKQVIDKINSVANKTDYIRQLILEDIKRG